MAQFNESKVITPLHPEKAEVGKKYWYSDHLVFLKERVENNNPVIGSLCSVTSGDDGDKIYPFYLAGHGCFQYLYPYEDTSEQGMTNQQIAEWLAAGNGQWKYISKIEMSVCTEYMYDADKENAQPKNIVIRPFWYRYLDKTNCNNIRKRLQEGELNMSKTTKEKIEVMQAYEEGKKIEYAITNSNNWSIASNPAWDWWNNDYRVKEEPKYRPYVDTEEMINDFCERSGAKRSTMGEPFIWVKDGDYKLLILSIEKDCVWTINCRLGMEELFDEFTYCDGSPIGKKE